MKRRKIKRKTIYGYDYEKSKRKFQKCLTWRSVYEFSRTGQLVEKRFYLKKGRTGGLNLCARGYFEYDNEGRQTGFKDYRANDGLIYRRITEYGMNSKKIISRSYTGDVVINKIVSVHRYNDIGNLVYEEYTNGGDERETYTYVYDKDNRLVREIVRNGKKSFNDHMCTYTYNEFSNVVKEEYSDPGNCARLIVRLIYDESRLLTARKNYAASGNLTQAIMYQYNESGDKVFQQLVHYHCNCTGVYQRPIDMQIIEYQYYRQ